MKDMHDWEVAIALGIGIFIGTLIAHVLGLG